MFTLEFSNLFFCVSRPKRFEREQKKRRFVVITLYWKRFLFLYVRLMRMEESMLLNRTPKIEYQIRRLTSRHCFSPVSTATKLYCFTPILGIAHTHTHLGWGRLLSQWSFIMSSDRHQNRYYPDIFFCTSYIIWANSRFYWRQSIESQFVKMSHFVAILKVPL